MTDGLRKAIQRPLEEARANEYTHVERGMTLGTVVEHRESGDWALVIDTLDDGRIRILNLEEVSDADIATLEDALGCVQHARRGRQIAAGLDGGEYLAPPEIFEVLGPTHPEFQRSNGGASD